MLGMCDAASHLRVTDRPLSILLVAVQVHVGAHVCDVHLDRAVGPGPEHQVTALFVERIVGDVYHATSLEDAARLPVHSPSVRHDRTEVSVLPMDTLRPASVNKRLYLTNEVQCLCWLQRIHNLTST